MLCATLIVILCNSAVMVHPIHFVHKNCMEFLKIASSDLIDWPSNNGPMEVEKHCLLQQKLCSQTAAMAASEEQQ